MLRRSHKKSRGGCLECKRRHIKCDEQRPVCLLCIRSERECSYASQTARESRSTEHSPSQSQHPSPVSLPTQALTPQTPVSSSDVDPSSSRNDKVDQNVPPDEALNMIHMELFAHIAVDTGVSNLGFGVEWYHPSGLSLAIKRGIQAPFLMHQLLAFSARHLAHLHPERANVFLHQAVTLQTRAISLFNTAWTSVDSSNCVPLLLFSSVLGHHLLADTLVKRDAGGLDAFIADYAHCVGMQRGVVTIAGSAWSLLIESELAHIIKLSSAFTARPPKGTHCQPVLDLIKGTQNLGDQEREACQAAINFLQVGIDAAITDEEEENRYQMIFSWTTLMPNEYMAMLTAKQPEALIIMAYYALLLHYGRHMWQVGDAGAYILGLIGDHLGPEWDPWLEFPRQQMRTDMNVDQAMSG